MKITSWNIAGIKARKNDIENLIRDIVRIFPVFRKPRRKTLPATRSVLNYRISINSFNLSGLYKLKKQPAELCHFRNYN